MSKAARQQLQRLMRDAEADVADVLSKDGRLTVLAGLLHGIPAPPHRLRHRMLTREHWVRMPELTAGEGLIPPHRPRLLLSPGRPR